ncbi:MAG: IS110 family transposase [Bacteroidota bacterium]|nr:IS110 family transposase [Bacteroidota bacterium]
MNETISLYCGIDVSCDTLDICYQVPDSGLHHAKLPNTEKGFVQLIKLTGHDYRFVMEATGVYHISLMFFLHQHQAAYSVVNALQIKRYIQMHLERNKSDRKDARRICEYGIERKPPASQMPDRLYFECKTLNNAIKKITTEITAFTNQIHSLEKLHAGSTMVIKAYQRIIKDLANEQQLLEKELDKKLVEWQPELVQRVSSVMAIGKRATAELIVYTQGFKDMKNYRRLISYAGLSHREFTSGSSIRGRSRICKQGGKTLRNILYMCSLSAVRSNLACKQLYERLVGQGKNKKLALIAVCNKLLKQVFAVVNHQTLFDNNYSKNIN